MAETAVLVWIRGPGVGYRLVRVASVSCSVRDLIHSHCQDQDVLVDCFFVKCNGSLISTSDTVQHGAVYSLEPRLRGGKGGFGSMLRALGAQIEKTTNREACRDLSGRRLRDVNHEKAMAEWVKQQAEREAKKEQRRLERLQRKLAEPRHCFTNPDYQQQCHEMAERLEDSVLKGMQAASCKAVSAEMAEPGKRPHKSETDGGPSAAKRKCFWLGMEGLETADVSGSGSSDDDSEEEAPTTSGMSFPVPKHGSDGVEMADEMPRRAGVLSTDCGSLESLQGPVMDSGHGISKDFCAALAETPTGDCAERMRAADTEDTQKKREAGSDGPTGKEAAGAGLNEEREAQELAGREQAATVAPGEARESMPGARLEASQAGGTAVGQESLDLLAFSSVAEMEMLGLEKLKCELTALGLKCGGTLQERAARLFSVRGLARGQIDPALFAKPKGKKR
ncbi:splicing regulator SDE2 [Saccopteryx leptura]|uniref:splicing regulator SDE2 n=1 Tax=Saccopteryx leptura TaxID=249018 RepID=UPI00339D26C6